MRIGFLDARSNTKDVFALFSEVAALEANVQLEHLTAPNPFKVPAAARQLFQKGCDAVIAFVTSDDENELGFLRDKLCDVEILESKYTFLVLEDSRVLEPQLKAVLSRALAEALDHAPGSGMPSAPQAASGMGMFSAPVEPAEEEVHDLMKGGDDAHRLF
ncbi:MAG TPA: hypothetical protein VI874_01860 [Candidatus Norongarragalinales archaeon]|nr:hypothetical protein [Candidatus Norongarragalinales archaeon]